MAKSHKRTHHKTVKKSVKNHRKVGGRKTKTGTKSKRAGRR